MVPNGTAFDTNVMLDSIPLVFGFGRAQVSGADPATVDLPYTAEQNGGFTPAGATVTGETSGATGTLVIAGAVGAVGTGHAYLRAVTGSFVAGENLQIAASTRGVCGTPNAAYVAQTPTGVALGYTTTNPNGTTGLKGSQLYDPVAGVTWLNTTGGTVWVAQRGVFISTLQTGTGAPQNIAHDIGRVPAFVVIVPVRGDNGAGAGGTQFSTFTEGAHDATNVIVTATTGSQYKVLAFA